MRARVIAIAALLTLPIATARAQTAPPSPDEAPAVMAGVEARRDRIRYHFDNPSSADTSFLVPHFFEQTYEADNIWLIGTARYVAGVRMESSAGVTPQRTGRADDYDTFFDPGNVVIVSGTTGDASMRSVFVSQRADIARAGPVTISVGYRLRWDRFDFHAGYKTVTRNGELIAASVVTSPEMTDSKVHEFPAGFRVAPRFGAWRLDVSGQISPLTIARLSVQLPEKYPGQDLVFFATVGASAVRVALVRPGSRWPIEVAVEIERTWSYRSTEQLSRSAQSIALSAGRAW